MFFSTLRMRNRTINRVAVRFFILILLTLLLCLDFMSCTSSAVSRELGAEYYAIAQDYSSQKNYTKAAEYYRKAKNSTTVYTAAAYGLARVYIIEKKYAEAEAELRPVVKKTPDNGIALSAYAYTLASLGRYDESLTYYRAVQARNELELSSGINFLSLLYYAGCYDEMATTVASFKELYPDDESIKKMAVLYSLKTSGEDGKKAAIAWLEQDGNETDTFVLTALAEYYREHDRYDDALNIYRKIKEPSVEILLEMAYICYEKNPVIVSVETKETDKKSDLKKDESTKGASTKTGEKTADSYVEKAFAKLSSEQRDKVLDTFCDRLSKKSRTAAERVINAKRAETTLTDKKNTDS